MHSRVADAASEREARIKYQEEAESSSRMVKKLKERQEAVASQSDMSAGEWQMKEERDKLLVSCLRPLARVTLAKGPEITSVFLLRTELQAAGHHQVHAQ